MLAKPKTPIFIDNLTIEVEEANHYPFHVALQSEDGKICCKTEKKIGFDKSTINLEGLDELPYGVYTVECSQGGDIVKVKSAVFPKPQESNQAIAAPIPTQTPTPYAVMKIPDAPMRNPAQASPLLQRVREIARMTARFAFYFTLIGIIPGALIYLLSVQFMSRSIESWFNVRVDTALESGLSLGRWCLLCPNRDLRFCTLSPIFPAEHSTRMLLGRQT